MSHQRAFNVGRRLPLARAVAPLALAILLVACGDSSMPEPEPGTGGSRPGTGGAPSTGTAGSGGRGGAGGGMPGSPGRPARRRRDQQSG